MNHNTIRLLDAIREGSLLAVRAALDDGADIEEGDVHGIPGLPLRTACFRGNLEIVEELLARGANPNSPSGDGPGGPLRLAVRCNHPDIAALLLARGAVVPPHLTTPHDLHGVGNQFPTAQSSKPMPARDVGNLIEFTVTEINPAVPLMDEATSIHERRLAVETTTLDLGIADVQPEDSFGNETRAISADLLFLDEYPLQPSTSSPEGNS